MNKRRSWKKGNRAFYWTPPGSSPYINHPLCLQSKEYNGDQKGVTWVYYSKTDTRELYQFLKKLHEEGAL